MSRPVARRWMERCLARAGETVRGAQGALCRAVLECDDLVDEERLGRFAESLEHASAVLERQHFFLGALALELPPGRSASLFAGHALEREQLDAAAAAIRQYLATPGEG